MPIFEYQCDCGRRLDVLVRNGKEPGNCEEAGEASDWCMKAGKLARTVTAAHVSSGGTRGYRSDTGQEVVTPAAGCGHCGQTPGSGES